MTQTGQNSAVRTFGRQVVALGDELFFSDRTSLMDATNIAERHILEAEARGAEEQRRKDAVRQEPIGYLSMTGLEQLASALHGYANLRRLPASDDFILKWGPDIPLYNRPANVAALEARVKVLEEYYEAAEAISFDASSEQCDRLDKARAALTREGESHQTAAMEARAEAEIEKWSR